MLSHTPQPAILTNPGAAKLPEGPPGCWFRCGELGLPAGLGGKQNAGVQRQLR